jgi:PAS domain S-box-containing protein
LSLNSDIEECNPAAAKLLGVSTTEAINKNLLEEFVVANSKKEISFLFSQLVSVGETNNLEIPILDFHGEYKLVLTTGKLQLDAENQPNGFIVYGQDITALRLQEGLINKKQKLEIIGQLTGGISHDLNNMLSIVLGNLRFLRELPGFDDPNAKELIEDVQSASEDAADLVNRLMSFGREVPSATITIPVEEALTKVRRLAKNLTKPGVELIFEEFKEPVSFKIDQVWFDNCLLNLIINARDAMDRGTIRVVSTVINPQSNSPLVSTTKEINVSVIDEGCGIPEADIKKVLEPFYTTKGLNGGTGLGLSMVDRFCELSNGHCSISSELGVGTKVSLTLPLIEEGPLKPRKLAEDEQGDFIKGILLVEDNDLVRKMVIRDLRVLGVSITEAVNADAAMVLLQRGDEFALVFSDIMMLGEYDGYDLANWIKQNRPEIQVLLTSAYAGTHESNEGIEFIRKPYNADILILKLRSLLDKRHESGI